MWFHLFLLILSQLSFLFNNPGTTPYKSRLIAFVHVRIVNQIRISGNRIHTPSMHSLIAVYDAIHLTTTAVCFSRKHVIKVVSMIHIVCNKAFKLFRVYDIIKIVTAMTICELWDRCSIGCIIFNPGWIFKISSELVLAHRWQLQIVLSGSEAICIIWNP